MPFELYFALLGGVGAFDEFDEDREIWPVDSPAEHDERQYVEGRRRDAHRFAEHAGLPFPETLGDLVALARYYGLLIDADEGLAIAQPLPLVTETGVLNVDEIAHEDALRWSGQYEPFAQRIIKLFVDANLDGWSGTLDQLAAAIDATVEDARHAVEQLVTESDFSSDHDPSTVSHDERISIRVDWDEFDRNRIHLAGPSPADES